MSYNWCVPELEVNQAQGVAVLVHTFTVPWLFVHDLLLHERRKLVATIDR